MMSREIYFRRDFGVKIRPACSIFADISDFHDFGDVLKICVPVSENGPATSKDKLFRIDLFATWWPGKFIFGEILWGQGPASMAYFSRSFRFSRFGVFLEICVPVSKIGLVTS